MLGLTNWAYAAFTNGNIGLNDMKPESLTFTFQLEDFDLKKLPIDAAILRSNRVMLESAVSDYFAEQFRALGGEAQISISQGVVTVRWLSEEGLPVLVEHSIALLQQGDHGTAVPMLRTALQHMPDNPVILFNLGMALSDLKQLADAITLLERLVTLQPDHAQGWNALGIAYVRNNDVQAAEQALRKSVQLAPDDGYSLRNLGGLIAKRSVKDALPFIKRAAELLPTDQAAQQGYGQALFEAGDTAAADQVLKQAIELNPLTPIAELARTLLTKIAHKNMRGAFGATPRMDVVMYCLAALKLFAESPEKCQAITFEIAMLGRQGLDINKPDIKYTLKSLPGTFSGLQLVSYMYVGFKRLSPTANISIDLSREYQQAQRLFEADETSTPGIADSLI